MDHSVRDKYQNFKQLSNGETYGVDYKIHLVKRERKVVIIAPHGGKIEPHTSLIAEKIADDRYDLYCFIGLKKSRNRDLHITSHHFDEPQCLALISHCEIVVAIHGRADDSDPETVYLGGLDTQLCNFMAKKLAEADFKGQIGGHAYPATKPLNICNRGRRKKGAQLEIPRTLRDKIQADCDLLNKLASTVRDAIESCF